MPAKTTKWDGAELLETPEAVAAYIEAAFDDGDPAVITHALGNVARAKGARNWKRSDGLRLPPRRG